MFWNGKSQHDTTCENKEPCKSNKAQTSMLTTHLLIETSKQSHKANLCITINLRWRQSFFVIFYGQIEKTAQE